jgi:hypothetical protein
MIFPFCDIMNISCLVGGFGTKFLGDKIERGVGRGYQLAALALWLSLRHYRPSDPRVELAVDFIRRFGLVP